VPYAIVTVFGNSNDPDSLALVPVPQSPACVIAKLIAAFSVRRWDGLLQPLPRMFAALAVIVQMGLAQPTLITKFTLLSVTIVVLVAVRFHGDAEVTHVDSPGEELLMHEAQAGGAGAPAEVVVDAMAPEALMYPDNVHLTVEVPIVIVLVPENGPTATP
jgi:hypothetical protein